MEAPVQPFGRNDDDRWLLYEVYVGRTPAVLQQGTRPPTIPAFVRADEYIRVRGVWSLRTRGQLSCHPRYPSLDRDICINQGLAFQQTTGRFGQKIFE